MREGGEREVESSSFLPEKHKRAVERDRVRQRKRDFQTDTTDREVYLRGGGEALCVQSPPCVRGPPGPPSPYRHPRGRLHARAHTGRARVKGWVRGQGTEHRTWEDQTVKGGAGRYDKIEGRIRHDASGG